VSTGEISRYFKVRKMLRDKDEKKRRGDGGRERPREHG
jgi:hypothetical protein